MLKIKEQRAFSLLGLLSPVSGERSETGEIGFPLDKIHSESIVNGSFFLSSRYNRKSLMQARKTITEKTDCRGVRYG